MRKVDYIVVHTAAHGSVERGVDYDTPAREIDEWHRARGWAGIGYHYVIRKDGTIEDGRPEHKVGAHTRGINRNSIGICFSGHGDVNPWTEAQMGTALALVHHLMLKYNVPAEQVIGHREIVDLIDAGKLDPRFHTFKSCPGYKVDLLDFRQRLRVFKAMNPLIGK